METLSPAYGIRLTRREDEIYKLITIGFSSKQIAAMLGISEYTVANHRKSILQKKGPKTVKTPGE